MDEQTSTTVDYKYEDEFSYITSDGELILKKTSVFDERKIAELDDDEIPSKIDDLKQRFDELETEVDSLIGKEAVTESEIDELLERLKTATAIGDFDSLHSRLQEAKETLKSGAAEEVQNEREEEPEEAGAEKQESEEEPIGYYNAIVEKAEDLAKQSDWPYVSMELDSLRRQWDEGPELDGPSVKELFEKFEKVCEEFEQRKQKHYEQLNKQKEENLERKKKLLDELREIIDKEKWGARNKVSSIQGKWSSIGPLPSGETPQLDEEFDRLIEEFEEHKVDRLVNKRQKEEENLTGKLVILDKMEEVAESIGEEVSDWKGLDKEFDKLTTQFRQIGRVPPEKSNEVWDRYKSAQDTYYDRKYKYDKKHRKQVDKFYSKKEKLCEKAEALLEEENLPRAAKEMNKLHRKWKKVGNLPQRDEDELWGRFKAATDAFNKRKSENVDKLKEQEEENYRKKEELIERARKNNDTTDWEKGHQIMQDLLKEWKQIGPVPRNKSKSVWKRFKEAQDVFYDRRRDHFKEVKEQRRENLQEKKEILKKLEELGKHQDPIEAVNQAKPLQEKFKEAGYVPIKKKNKIWKEYREACDIIYERFRAAKSGNKFDQELAKADLDPEQRSKILDIRKEYKKVKKEMHKLEEEALQYKESKTYFKSTSGKENPLMNEIHEKIENVETNLRKKREKLESLDQQIEELREEA